LIDNIRTIDRTYKVFYKGVVNEPLKKFALLGTGALIGLAQLKFTICVVFVNLNFLQWPSTLQDWIFGSWPNNIFYILLLPVCIALFGTRRPIKFTLFSLTAPLLFLLVQLISLATSVHPEISLATVFLFASLILAYWMGWQVVRGPEDLAVLLKFWIAACILIILLGFIQANGGLDETRAYLKAHPEIAKDNPELWNKVKTNRIFATFMNPNIFGGYIISSLFIVGLCVFNSKKASISRFFYGLLIVALFYCLIKSFSKGSYLSLFLTIGLTTIIFIPNLKKMGLILFGAIIISLVGFQIGLGKHALVTGKATWDARVGYWQAAWKIGKDYPVTGSGPGTFSVMHPRYQVEGGEGTRLVHNNYLQMWCDSGILGFISFAVWFLGALLITMRKLRRSPKNIPLKLVFLWSACTAFAVHSLVDLDLYVISNSWPIFLLLGIVSAAAENQHNDIASDSKKVFKDKKRSRK